MKSTPYYGIKALMRKKNP